MSSDDADAGDEFGRGVQMMSSGDKFIRSSDAGEEYRRMQEREDSRLV